MNLSPDDQAHLGRVIAAAKTVIAQASEHFDSPTDAVIGFLLAAAALHSKGAEQHVQCIECDYLPLDELLRIASNLAHTYVRVEILTPQTKAGAH